MNASFDWKKTLVALGLAAVLVGAAVWFGSAFPRDEKAEERERPDRVAGGPPGISNVNFADFVSQLPEEKKRCVQNAYGPLYDKLVGPDHDPNFRIPDSEEWRVEEANKCFK